MYHLRKLVQRARRGVACALLALAACTTVSVAAFPQSQPTIGSTFVPLDSWVYPALDRLRALGYTHTQFMGLRPWTRLMCARLVHEAAQSLRPGDLNATKMYNQLADEFQPELGYLGGDPSQTVTIDSVYGRVMGIGGDEPLRDSWHFGQTIANDFGRPFGQGVNAVVGMSARAQRGRFFIAFRGEYQHAPALPGFDSNVQSVIAKIDQTSSAPLLFPQDQRDRFNLLDTYAGVAFGAFELTFGKQSLWYGPGTSGALLFSNNIDPPYMLRLDQVNPVRLPSFLKYLGNIRTEFFFGKLSGHSFPARPFMHGEKVTLKPTDNLEVGFTRMTVFLGEGNGFTLGRIIHSYFSVGDNLGSNRSNSDPGDRKGGLDASYRVPGLRDWVTIYTDSFTDDDPLPLSAPHRAAWNPGIYMPKLPGLPSLDLRVEGVTTDIHSEATVGHFVYYNGIYKDGYTQNGFIIGNTIGRGGRAIQATSTYWFNARNDIQVGFKTGTVDYRYIPGGGGQKDYNVRADWLVKKNIALSGFVQYEHWSFPLLAATPQNNVAAWLSITIDPKLEWGHARTALHRDSTSRPSTQDLKQE
ncbi:hypothetical protein Acid345_0833 [Candidatus Koribacter versatilis Ellin345]|uniref:Capsule assembly protein Wzi n=1 Tax=Koribacter versatilis (strain Ellin345) TaxID=204669 RepID=Q1ITG2_KORVE|nr:capsule assembly Wzi family protein [Candidatus Koribacter versatilis]ABF39838.1 hypothetical protein Acid345_0833 [Candidatus Koribacter versatilis Ellin345]